MVKSKRVGHTPMWPQYLPESFPVRELFLLEKGKIYDAKGKSTKIDTFKDIADYLFVHNGMAFVRSLISPQTTVDEMLTTNGTRILSTKKGKPQSIRIERKHETRWIQRLEQWDRNERTIFSLVDTFNYLGVGTHATTGSEGHAIMRDCWRKYFLQFHTAPSKLARSFLYDHHIGGRCDTPGLGNLYTTVLELDMSSAYLAHFLIHPTGTSIPFHENNVRLFWTYFCQCIVTIPYELPLGPFPMRTLDKRIVYPTLPGKYNCYLWKEQIEDAKAMGCDVQLIRGFGWKYFTEDNSYWAKDMFRYRMDSKSDRIEQDTKQVSVSAIGKHGTRGTYHFLVKKPKKGAREKIAVADDDRALNYFVREEINWNNPAMVHWLSYTIMQCSRTLFKYALPYAIEGRLIATNYDALFIIASNETQRYYRKYTLEAKMAEMGDLRWTRLHNFYVKAARSYECDVEMPDGTIRKRKILPGIERERKVST